MTDHRSSEEIEREIERERAGLTDTLDDLQDRFSPDALVRQVTDQFREHGGDIGRTVSRAVKENPMALALTGVGLAWMIFGKSGQPTRGELYDSRDRRDEWSADRYRAEQLSARRYARDPLDAHSRYSSSAAADRHYDTNRGYGAQSQLPSWADHSDDDWSSDDSGYGDRVRDAGSAASDRVAGAYGSATDKASDMASGVSSSARGAAQGASDMAAGARDRVAQAGQSVSDAAGSARAGIADRADRMAAQGRAFQARLAEGTEAMSEEARARIVAARDQAVQARAAAARRLRQGGEKAADLYEEQPLIIGALALAVGAAIGAALPRTDIEDEHLGAQSDRLMDEAERIFQEEKSKLEDVAAAATSEAKTIAEEVKADANQAKADADEAAPADNAAQAVADRVKESGQRIGDAAMSKAEEKDLGRMKT